VLSFIIASLYFGPTQVNNSSLEVFNCNQIDRFVGLKIDKFPKEQFSKIRLVKQGTPMTFDYVSDRSTVIYNDENVIIYGSCG